MLFTGSNKKTTIMAVLFICRNIVFATSIESIPSTTTVGVTPIAESTHVGQIDPYILQSYEYAVKNGLLVEEDDDANDEDLVTITMINPRLKMMMADKVVVTYM